MPVTRDTLVMATSASAAIFCLACGQATTPSNRRILYSEASRHVRITWEDLLDEKLQQKGLEVDKASVLGNLRSPSPGCVCKKCFSAVNSFGDKKIHLLSNLDEAIVRMPTKIRSSESRLPEVDHTPVRRAGKRMCPCTYEQTSKHPRLTKRADINFVCN